MNLAAFAAVGAGAACGAWLRWGLGVWLNPVFALVPLGTLAANLLGGLLMGVALAAVQAWPTISPERSSRRLLNASCRRRVSGAGAVLLGMSMASS